ncbi:MAG: hypothetical protein Crog4KO_31950 [Crocinitomicaceae bacterium]
MNKSFTLTLLTIAFFLSGCNPYRKITYKKVDFYKKQKVVEKMDNYDIYLQQGDETYEFEVAEREGDVLKGRAKRVAKNDIQPTENSEKHETRSVSKEMRDDMIVRVEDGLDVDQNIAEGEYTTISPDVVQDVAVYAKEDQGVIGGIGTALLIALGVLLALILILVLAISSAVSDSGSGTSDSGSSTSDSNSNSGTSGCFIATMAYGSYDAKEVLVLRSFRDNFLQNFGMGRAFIRWYYANSPAFVSQHQGKMWLHRSLRVFLNSMVWILKPFFPVK